MITGLLGFGVFGSTLATLACMIYGERVIPALYWALFFASIGLVCAVILMGVEPLNV